MYSTLDAARAKTLKTVPLFLACDDDELAEIDTLLDEIEVEGGEILTREGQHGGESFIILSGEASVVVRERGVARLRQGDFFGEMTLLTPERPRSATVVAITPMRLLVVDPRSFTRLTEIPSVAQRLLATVIERLRACQASPRAS